eukprot:TRINITY_DN7457_c0_g1_i1.p1 TRINITY_DN7457_c0_g1~~TRINITY_DN7457_c0_g1_i1.p1  ORF type:complete len:477 (+),score=175.71 TRINITY_DN7457_c0_g1_i1:140-1432(+)
MGNLCLKRPDKESNAAAEELLQRPLRDINDKLSDVGGLECGELDVSHLLTHGDPHTVFTFGDPIGEGSFAPVYRATDKRDAHQVAIKLVTLYTEDQARSVALETAAQLKAQNHDNIAKVYGLWMDLAWTELCTFSGQRLWIIQELVLGLEAAPRSVADSLREHAEAQASASTGEVRALMTQLSSALAHMHSRGVVHRDLKPENIMIQGGDPSAGEGKYKIIDFGSALLLRKGEDQHRDSALIGTFSYLAPECYDFIYSCKADVFSLACLAGEAWLTGDKSIPPPWSPLELLKTPDGSATMIEACGMRMVEAEDEAQLRAACKELVAALRGDILSQAQLRLKKRKDKYKLCGAKERQKKVDAELLQPLLSRMLQADPCDRPSMLQVQQCLELGNFTPFEPPAEPPPAAAADGAAAAAAPGNGAAGEAPPDR